MASMDRHLISFHQDMDDLNRFCNDKHIPDDLRLSLRKYFLDRGRASLHATEKQLCNTMSPQLKSAVTYARNKAWMLRVSFLRKAARPFQVHIADAMDCECHAQG